MALKFNPFTGELDNIGGKITPGGINSQVQFNDSSAFGGDAGLTYNKATGTLVSTNVKTSDLLVNVTGGQAEIYGDGTDLVVNNALGNIALTANAVTVGPVELTGSLDLKGNVVKDTNRTRMPSYGIGDIALARQYDAFSLSDYNLKYLTLDLPVVTADFSSITYSGKTNTLFGTTNTTGSRSIYEFTIAGAHLRTITLTNFLDTEGICWMYGDTFAICQERVAGPYIIICTIDSGTSTLDRTNCITITPSISITDNLGMEGVSYDIDNNLFYVAVEKQSGGGSGGRVFTVAMDGTATELTTLGTALSSAGVTDLADIYYERNSKKIFLMAQENSRVYECSQTAVIGYIATPAGMSQPEGLGFTPDGSRMFVSGELDDLGVYIRNPINHILETTSTNVKVKGSLSLLETGSTPTYTTTIQAGDQAGNVTLTLPTAAPASNGYVLSGTTAGVLSWAAPSGGSGAPGGSDTQVQFNDSSAFGGDSGLTYNKTTDVLSVVGGVNSKTLTQTNGGNTWTQGVDTNGEYTLKKGATTFLTGSLDSDDITFRVPTFHDDVTTFQKHIVIASETPASPTNGDLWYNGTDLFGRVNGATQSLTSVNTSDFATSSNYKHKNLSIWGNSISKGTGEALDATYTARKIHNRGQGSETSTQVRTRMVADTNLANYPVVLWPAYEDLSVPATAEDNIDAMVAAIATPKSFVILGYIPDSNTWIGSAGYTNMQTVNTYLATNYPSNYIDILTYLQSYGDGGANDNTDIANGIVPRSLRVDTIHLTPAAYTLVANRIATFFASDDAANNTSKILSYLDNPIIKTTNLNILAGGALEYAGIPALIGNNALYNYFFGNSGNHTASGGKNMAAGFAALRYLTSGTWNTAWGEDSQRYTQNGTANNSLGYRSLYLNINGTGNNCFGMNAGYSNVSGNYLACFGHAAGASNVSGIELTAVGYNSCYSSLANYNTGVGSWSLKATTSGGSNSVFGAYGFAGNTIGERNTGGGLNVFRSLVGAYHDNVGLGANCGRFLADGSTGMTSPSQCTFIGANVRGNTVGDVNAIAIGYAALSAGSNTVVIGNSSITETNLRGTVKLDKIAILEGGSTPTYRTTIQGGDQAGNITLTLPTAAPTVDGQALTATTAGVMSWTTPSAGGGGITWNEVTGTTQAAAVDNGYICNNASLVTVTLPATCALGKTIRVTGKGSGGWKIAQNAGQSIKILSSTSTNGVTGYVSSTNTYDSIELLCITADTTFVAISMMGNLTIS